MPDPTSDDAPRPPAWRQGAVLVAGVLVLVAVVVAVLLQRGGDDTPSPGLTVTWGGGEGHPACRYDAPEHRVQAQVTVDGTPADGSATVTVTITAYADENTSKPVGSTTRDVPVDGPVHLDLVVVVPVTRAPHVDEDGVAACRLEVTGAVV